MYLAHDAISPLGLHDVVCHGVAVVLGQYHDNRVVAPIASQAVDSIVALKSLCVNRLLSVFLFFRVARRKGNGDAENDGKDKNKFM